MKITRGVEEDGMVASIDNFHEMEIKHNLFLLRGKSDLPIWDAIRLHVFFKVYYKQEDLQRLSLRPKMKLEKIPLLIREFFISIYLFLFQSGQNVFLTSSGAKNDKGKFYDKSAYPLISSFSPNIFIIESNSKPNFLYITFNGFLKLYKPFFKTEFLSKSDFDQIKDALSEYYPTLIINFDELNGIFNSFQIDFYYYKWLFSIKKTEKLFISRGDEKGAFLAGKKLGIRTFEIQHAAIEFDNPLYSYPSQISLNSNIAYPTIFLNFGSFWMKNIHIPSKEKFSIGIDYPKNPLASKSGDSILIVSTIIHGEELANLAKELAQEDKSTILKFKLHPNEYLRKDHYKKIFQKFQNIEVISDEFNVRELIMESKLVVLIVSTVLYEAVFLGKKVGVYEKLNFSSQRNAFSLPNVFCFKTVSEIIEILDKPTIENYEHGIFEPVNLKLIELIKTGNLLFLYYFVSIISSYI